VAALLNHSETSLNLATVKDVFSIKSSNQTFKTKAGKLQFLAQVRDKLSRLPFNSMELQKIQSSINEQALGVLGKRKTIDACSSNILIFGNGEMLSSFQK
jgi:hypothetical protein